MSKTHLDKFLDDVKATNPQFRVFTSSLKKLIAHLESRVNQPAPMTEQSALLLCSNFRPGRVDKYKPAIKRLVSVWGQPSRPYPQAPRGNLLSDADINRICFRGDSRPPAEIFSMGFVKRQEGATATYRGGTVAGAAGSPNPVIDKIIGLKKAGDLEPSSAVCVTPDMHVAALFPLPVITMLKNFDPVKVDTWIYMTYITTGSHTHGRQVLDALAGLDALREIEPTGVGTFSPAEVTAARVDEIMQNLYGRELATDQIMPSSIWYGFKIRRTWAKEIQRTSYTEKGKVTGAEGDYKAGGSYTILQVIKNESAIYPPNERWQMVASELALDLLGKVFIMPTHKEGFTPSTIRTLR